MKTSVKAEKEAAIKRCVLSAGECKVIAFLRMSGDEFMMVHLF